MCNQQIEIFMRSFSEIIQTENKKLISEIERHNSELLSYYKNRSEIEDLIIMYDLIDKLSVKIKNMVDSNLKIPFNKNITNEFSEPNKELRLTTLPENDHSQRDSNDDSYLLNKDIFEDVLELKEASERTLGKNFVKRVDTNPGNKFEPKIHRIIENKETNILSEKNTVYKVLKDGFIYENPENNEKVIIRPSWVEIYK